MLLLLLAFLFLSRDSMDIGFGSSRVHFLLLVVNELKPGRGRPPDKCSSGKGMGGRCWHPRPLLLSLAQLQTACLNRGPKPSLCVVSSTLRLTPLLEASALCLGSQGTALSFHRGPLFWQMRCGGGHAPALSLSLNPSEHRDKNNLLEQWFLPYMHI